MPHTVTDMPHTLMLHTESPLPSATNTSAPQLPPMESTNCTSVKPKLMLNQKLIMADMDMDTPDTVTDMLTDMPVTDTELVITATHTADTDIIINLLLNKPNFTN